MQGWQTVKLGDVCEVIAGQSPKGEYYNDKGDGLPFYQGKKDFGEKYIQAPTKWTTSITKEAFEDDILMSVRAPVGPINFATQKICIGRGLAAIRASDKIDRDFLYFYLLSKQSEIAGNEGAVFPSINKSQISQIDTILPPLPEQQRIVEILDHAFEGIDKAIENTEKNLKNASELFESELNRIFTQKGDGWQTVKLGDVCIVKPPKKEARNLLLMEDEVSFVPMNNLPINSKDLELSCTKKLSEVISGYTYFADNDVLLAKITPCFENGKLGLARNLKNGIGFGSSEYIVLRSKGGLLPEYIYFYLSRRRFRELGSEVMTGAVGHKRVPLEYVQNSEIPLLDIDTQKMVVEKLNMLFGGVEQLEQNYTQKLEHLYNLKQSLLQKAFTGELTKNMAHTTTKQALGA